MKNKKILVTGGAGFVGTNLIKLILNKTNYKVIPFCYALDTIEIAERLIQNA